MKYPRFNGAVPVKARKVHITRRAAAPGSVLQWGRACEGTEGGLMSITAHPAASFNGAVPVKARKVTLLEVYAPARAALQWGRACEGTEGYAHAATPAAMPVLQWGRACEGTEGAATYRTAHHSAVLQWGRACEGTEGWRDRLIASGYNRFNGAVPVKARKDRGYTDSP